jgi:hypothetical protein
MVRMNTSTFRGGYYSHGKQFIEHLPLPPATPAQRAEIERLVAEIIAATDDLNSARTPHQQTLHKRRVSELRATVENRVSHLFGLSQADLSIANAVPIPA